MIKTYFLENTYLNMQSSWNIYS